MLDLADGRFLKTLRMLRIVTRRFFRGQKIGVRRSTNRGGGVEFADYKEYHPGDDLRFLDWRIYGRLDKLFIKLFHSEESLEVYVLVDASASMRFGNPSKLDYALRVAAAVAYIAAANHDHVRVMSFGEKIRKASKPVMKTGQVLNLFSFLQGIKAEGRTDLPGAVKDFALRHRRPGVVFVISDLLEDEGWREALKLLRFHRHDVNLIQVLDEEEVDPRFAGAWTFVDAESETEERLFVDGRLLDLYRETAEAYFQDIEDCCKQSGVNYFKSLTRVPFENMIMQFFGR